MIKNNYGTYNEILEIPLHLLIRHYEWFTNDYKEEMKFKREYDIALMKAFRCPLYAK